MKLSVILMFALLSLYSLSSHAQVLKPIGFSPSGFGLAKITKMEQDTSWTLTKAKLIVSYERPCDQKFVQVVVAVGGDELSMHFKAEEPILNVAVLLAPQPPEQNCTGPVKETAEAYPDIQMGTIGGVISTP